LLLTSSQFATFAWVNFFFSGFIVARTPFPLTQRFRGMLQRGVDLPQLDVTYVSSQAWYFLVMFGLRGVLALWLGEATVDDSALMQQQMAMAQGMDTAKAYVAERDALLSQPHEWALPKVEAAAAERLRGMLSARTL